MILEKIKLPFDWMDVLLFLLCALAALGAWKLVEIVQWCAEHINITIS